MTNANGLIVTPTLLGLSLDEMDVEDHSRESAEKAKPQGTFHSCTAASRH